MKKILLCLIIIAMLFCFAGCDYGLYIVGVEIRSYPDNLVYIANQDSEIDLTGGFLNMLLLSGSKSKKPMTDDYFTLSHNIDFTAPGVYVVRLSIRNGEYVEFPVQVIDKAYVKLYN